MASSLALLGSLPATVLAAGEPALLPTAWTTSVQPALPVAPAPILERGRRARIQARAAGVSATQAAARALNSMADPAHAQDGFKYPLAPTLVQATERRAEPPPAPAPSAPSPPASAPAPTVETSAEYKAAVQQFCANIGPTAIEARVAWQQKAIADLETEMDKRIAMLDARIAEHKDWLAKRHAFASRVGDGLVQLMTRIRPDAAAQQMASMDEETAAALLMKLDAKTAGALLGEVPAQKAARLASLIATAAGIGSKRGEATAKENRPEAKR